MKFRILGIVAALFFIAFAVNAQQRLNSSGRCPGGYACQIGEDNTTSFLINTDGGDVLVDDTANALTIRATTTGTATLLGADAAGAANLLIDTSGAGAITVGSPDVTAVTVTTDGGSVVLDGSLSPADTLTFATNGDSINNLVDATFDFTRDDAGVVTLTCSDDDATAGCTYDAGGASPIVIGSADVTAVTITTDDTGDGTDLVLPANSVNSSEILTIVESIYWSAAELSADGAQCADAAQESTIAGPELYVIVCTDNDAGLIGGSVVMPDSWDAGTVTFEYTTVQTGAETLVVNGDMEVQCRGDGEAIADTWSAEVAMDDAAQVGSSGTDTIQTASAITPAGTCAAGDLLIWQYSVDATGTTATVATNNFLGFKMEYTSNVGD